MSSTMTGYSPILNPERGTLNAELFKWSIRHPDLSGLFKWSIRHPDLSGLFKLQTD